MRHRLRPCLVFSVFATLATCGGSCLDGGDGHCEEAALFQTKAVNSTKKGHWPAASPVPVSTVPIGTNFGGWLCLEDWFFSGQDGRFVSTTDEAGQGVCLPPLLQGDSTKWPSEGILVHRLKKAHGEKYASQVFETHRNTFVQYADLKAMADLGIKVIRVPVVWALFADALAEVAPIYGQHDPHTEHAVVPDPFYPEEASLVTIPRKLLEDLFAQGHQLGLKFLLDLHAFPGGSSEGTYNGIWPLKPVFWKEKMKVGTQETSGQTAGLLIVQKAMQWLGSLQGDALAGVEGISPMNEPGHLSAILPEPFAPLDEVLAWLSQTMHMFKNSTLPAKGKKLYMQIIETAFPDNSFWNVFPQWWLQQTSVTDRDTWAVADIHWYTAWGTKAGILQESSAVLCNQPLSNILEVLTPGVQEFAQTFSEHIPGLKSCSEFSASTNADALMACQSLDITKPWMEAQVTAMKTHGISPFFWSFKMPYGRVFESGWSLRKIYGLEENAPFQCALNAGLQGADASVPCFAGDC